MMAISQNRALSDQLFVPWHTATRGGDGSNPVGTIAVDALATGAAGGGTVTLRLQQSIEQFGFPLVWVPTWIAVTDNLASAEPVQLTLGSTGNRRLNADVSHTILTVADGQGLNNGNLENVTVPIEGRTVADGTVITAVWDTNTDTKSYHIHAFGAVFDLQLLAREGQVWPLLAGLR